MTGRTWLQVSCAALMLLGRLFPAMQAGRPQAGAPAADGVVEFRFEHPQATVPVYRIVLDANGEGTYTEVRRQRGRRLRSCRPYPAKPNRTSTRDRQRWRRSSRAGAV